MRLLRGHIQAMADRFDVIVPLPVTEKRLRERGFNQSFIIAEEIGGMTGKPLNYNVLFKTKETRDQYLLSRQERRSNVRGAFAVKNNKEMAKMTRCPDSSCTPRGLRRGGVDVPASPGNISLG